jgi:hypothetical protein
MQTLSSLLRLFGLLCAAYTAVTVLITLFTFRKERPVGVISPLVSAFLSFAMLPIYILFSGARLNLILGIPILLFGVLVGFLRGLATRLYSRQGQVVGKNSMFFLLGWGGSLVLAQLLTLTGSTLLASVGLLPLFLSTGTQVGINANLFLRRLLVQLSPASN